MKFRSLTQAQQRSMLTLYVGGEQWHYFQRNMLATYEALERRGFAELEFAPLRVRLTRAGRELIEFHQHEQQAAADFERRFNEATKATPPGSE